MNKAQIVEMAKAAGFRTGEVTLSVGTPIPFIAPVSSTTCMVEVENLIRLAADHTRNEIAQEHERQYLKGFQAGKEFALEEAARACDDVDEPGWYGYECPNTFQDGCLSCAAAIRAMKGNP